MHCTLTDYANFLIYIFIDLFPPHNTVAQANKTGTSKNTTNEKEKVMTVPLYTHKLCNIKFTISTTCTQYLTIWHNKFV